MCRKETIQTNKPNFLAPASTSGKHPTNRRQLSHDICKINIRYSLKRKVFLELFTCHLFTLWNNSLCWNLLPHHRESDGEVEASGLSITIQLIILVLVEEDTTTYLPTGTYSTSLLKSTLTAQCGM